MSQSTPRAHLQLIRENCLEGSVELDAKRPFSFEITIDNRAAVPVELSGSGFDTGTDLSVPFQAAVPGWVFDGEEHSIIAVLDDVPFSDAFSFQSRYAGRLDGYRADGVYGWAVDLSRIGSSISVSLVINGRKAGERRADIFREDLKDAGFAGGNHGFLFPLPPEFRGRESKKIEIQVSGTDVSITTDPLLVVDAPAYENLVHGMTAGVRRILNRAERNGAESLPELAAGLSPEEAKALVRQMFGAGSIADLLYLERCLPLLDLKPGQPAVSESSAMCREIGSRWPANRALSQPVDVVVPVYKGIEETVQCIRSVLNSVNSTQFEVICILDNPQDSEMAKAVESAAKGRNVTILSNPENVGFVRSVNRGMRVHPDRDVVLLNSDTVVHRDWLDRLRRAAHSSPEIGTATPFSNSATICSYPKFCEDNEIPPDCSDGELDRICETENSSAVIDIPTAVGFCMYIRRDCLDSAGPFNEKLFGKGYGEENDFCRRAASRGWRNVLAADTFVRHLGSVSFGPGKAAIVSENLRALHTLHPHYDELIAAFVAQDPIRPMRRRIDAARLRKLAGPAFCFVSHDLGGGTNTYAGRIGQALLEDGISPLLLQCSRNGSIELKLLKEGRLAEGGVPHLPNLCYAAGEFEALVADLSRLPIEHFHFQTNINVPDSVLTLPGRLRAAYDVTVHDYSWICPRVNLVDETRKYCGEPPVEVCERCIKLFGPHREWNFDASGAAPVYALREHSAAFFRDARRVFCPSNDVRIRMENYFPEANFVVHPHEERLAEFENLAAPPEPERLVTVAVIGAIGIEKGSDILRRCAYDAWKRSLPLRFVVIGYTDDDENFTKFPNVTVSGTYNERTLPGLLREHMVTLSFFPAVWPETFSYTLSIALRHRLYPIAFDLGAIAERIRQTGFGHLLPLAAADCPERINRALLDHARWMDTEASPRLSDVVYPGALRDYYGLGKLPEHASHSLRSAASGSTLDNRRTTQAGH